MIKFTFGKCPKCGQHHELMLSNNPLSGVDICFDCIGSIIDPNNLEQAEFFCRTYNLPWQPDLWLQLVKENISTVFKDYTSAMLDDDANKPNLAYSSSTKDLWARTNKEWEKCRSFTQILNKLKPIRESYLDRGHLKWGTKYSFEDLIQLDSLYTRTLKANNIINPMQKQAVKTLCKIHIEMDAAIAAQDAKAMKDYATAYDKFAKEANLDAMINETKTEDITTVGELSSYCEKKGFVPTYYDGVTRDEVDAAIKDIQDTNRRLILENTGLQTTLEEMLNQRMRNQEEMQTQHATSEEGHTLQDLIDFKPEDTEVETEADTDATDMEFSNEEDA